MHLIKRRICDYDLIHRKNIGMIGYETLFNSIALEIRCKYKDITIEYQKKNSFFFAPIDFNFFLLI